MPTTSTNTKPTNGTYWPRWALEIIIVSDGVSSIGTQRNILVALAICANRDAESWLSVTKIAVRIGASRSTVTRGLDALAAQGHIEAVAGRSGGRTSTRWRLLDWRQPRHDDGDEPCQPHRGESVEAVQPRRAAAVEPVDTTVQPRRAAAVAETQPRRAAAAADAVQSTNRVVLQREDLEDLVEDLGGDACARAREAPDTGDAPTTEPPPEERSSNPKDQAHAALTDWWEAQDPPPAQPFAAALRACTEVLVVGWTETDLRRGLAGLDDPPITRGSLDLGRGRAGRGGRPPADDELAEWASVSRIDVERRRAETAAAVAKATADYLAGAG